VCARAHMYVRMYVCIYVCMYVCMYIQGLAEIHDDVAEQF